MREYLRLLPNDTIFLLQRSILMGILIPVSSISSKKWI